MTVKELKDLITSSSPLIVAISTEVTSQLHAIKLTWPLESILTQIAKTTQKPSHMVDPIALVMEWPQIAAEHLFFTAMMVNLYQLEIMVQIQLAKTLIFNHSLNLKGRMLCGRRG
jgi:hypothetical protein